MKIVITDKLKKRRAETLGFDIAIDLISELKLHGQVEIDIADEPGVDDLVDGGFAILPDSDILEPHIDAPELNKEVSDDTTD